MTRAAYRSSRQRSAMPGSRSKYGARRSGQFASQVEAAYYAELALRERAGEIADLYPHPAFNVEPDGCKSIKYTADFVYVECSGRQLVVVDVKGGAILPDASIRMRLFRWKYPQYRLEIVRRVRGQWVVTPFGTRRRKAEIASEKNRAAFGIPLRKVEAE